VNTAGPTVTSVSLLKARHRISGLVIQFSGALSGGSAGNAVNYSVNLLGMRRFARHGFRQLSVGKAVRVNAAAYNPAGHSVTLTFGSKYKISQAFQLRVNSGQGGVSDPAGDPLNSPSRGVAGSDFVATVNPPAT
jgi:hypothetical protein